MSITDTTFGLYVKKFQSESRPDLEHVALAKITCGCEAFYWSGQKGVATCKHVQRLALRMSGHKHKPIKGSPDWCECGASCTIGDNGRRAWTLPPINTTA